MTQTFGVNANNDLYIDSNGNLAIVSGLEAVKQACETAVKAQSGEMIYAFSSGIPNFQAVWVGDPNVGQFRAAIRRTLLSVSGVTAVKSINITQQDNVLIYQAFITTTFGDTTANGQLQF